MAQQKDTAPAPKPAAQKLSLDEFCNLLLGRPGKRCVEAIAAFARETPVHIRAELAEWERRWEEFLRRPMP